MTTTSFSELIDQGVTALNREDTLTALLFFQEAAVVAKTPTVLSCLGYCLAREHGETKKGVALCLEALQKEPQSALHYLNLGRTYLVARQKPLALQTFRKGLKVQRHQGIVEELKKLGIRRKPVFPSLPRENALNRYFGSLLHRLGLR